MLGNTNNLIKNQKRGNKLISIYNTDNHNQDQININPYTHNNSLPNKGKNSNINNINNNTNVHVNVNVNSTKHAVTLGNSLNNSPMLKKQSLQDRFLDTQKQIQMQEDFSQSKTKKNKLQDYYSKTNNNKNNPNSNQNQNPYLNLKKFNVRRLTKTQQSTPQQNQFTTIIKPANFSSKPKSISSSKQKYDKYGSLNMKQKVHLETGIMQKLQSITQTQAQNKNQYNKHYQDSKKSNKFKAREMITITQKFKTLQTLQTSAQDKNFQNNTLEKNKIRKNKELFKNVPKPNTNTIINTNTNSYQNTIHRFQTEANSHKARLTDLQKSPYKKYLLKVDNLNGNSHQNTQNNMRNQSQFDLDDAALQEKKKNYSFLTKFQLQEIQNYQIYYPGQRRVGSLRHFTDNNGNAKISIGDSIIYRYQIKGMLGQGSFGQVFKAYDHKKKENIALKIIKNTPKFNAQAKVQIKILQNALMQDPKNKSNIVRLKHAFIFRGHACLSFELLHINLYQFLKLTGFSGMSTDLIRRIAIQILQGLQFFNKSNIIHCDLKPQNILLKQQNKTGIKIIDVGSGCYETEQIYTYIQSRFYRAPQIILGLHYTSAIDMWSFGCILCQLFLGYPIFPGQNQQEQILMFMELFGVPDEALIDCGSRSRKFFTDYIPKIQPNSKGRIRTPSSKSLQKVLKGCDDKLFIEFLFKCFRWTPQKRLTAKQALLDEWIISGLPQQLREQHRQSVIKNHFY